MESFSVGGQAVVGSSTHLCTGPAVIHSGCAPTPSNIPTISWGVQRRSEILLQEGCDPADQPPSPVYDGDHDVRAGQTLTIPESPPYSRATVSSLLAAVLHGGSPIDLERVQTQNPEYRGRQGIRAAVRVAELEQISNNNAFVSEDPRSGGRPVPPLSGCYPDVCNWWVMLACCTAPQDRRAPLIDPPSPQRSPRIQQSYRAFDALSLSLARNHCRFTSIPSIYSNTWSTGTK